MHFHGTPDDTKGINWMANFATHIGVGTVVSGALATITLAADVVAPESLVAVTLAGVLGSVLPDIDLKDSRASRAFFSGLAAFLSFCVLFANAQKYSIAELWLLWLGAFVLIRYGAEAVFHRFSYHRGIWHSLLAALFFWFATAITFKYALGRHEGVAWLAGGFMFVGYITHLLLDEMYSVDLMGKRLKASFGSALKFYDARSYGETATVAVLTVVLFLLSPPSDAFVKGISSAQLWSGLQQRMLPESKWFGVVSKKTFSLDYARRTGTAAPSGITTGSVKPVAPQPSAVRPGGAGASAPK